CDIRRDTHWRPEEWTHDGSSTSWATPRSRIPCAPRRCRPSRSRISGADSPVRARLLGMVTPPNGCQLAVKQVASCLWILPAVPRANGRSKQRETSLPECLGFLDPRYKPSSDLIDSAVASCMP